MSLSSSDQPFVAELPSPLPKVALVTGAARRVGKAIALELAHAGYAIGVHYGHSQHEAEATVAEIRTLGVAAFALHADLADEGQTRALLAACFEMLGPVSVLVNNAALFEYDCIGDMDYASLLRHLLPNLAAPLVLTQSLAETLAEGQKAVVINLLDQKLYNYNPDFLSYTLTKAGLQAATTMLAQALAPRIRVVGVAPGISLPSADQTEQAFQVAHQQTPLGCSSTPQDIARTVRFVAESSAITGTTIVVDGGQHLQASARDVMFMSRG